LIIFQRCRK